LRQGADSAQIPDSGCESPQVAAEAEGLLIHALDDTEEYTIVLGWGDKSSYDPRLCDLAGYVLSLRWPERYEFDPESPLVELDRQLVELKNVWREARGFAPLPLPEALRVLDEGSHANTVQKVVVAPDSVELNTPLAERLEALKGKPLTLKGLVGLLLAFTGRLPPGATSIKIHADRAGDDTGVILNVRLTETVSQINAQEGWTYRFLVIMGHEALYNSHSDMAYEHGQTEQAYEELVEALDEALEAPPDEAFELRLSVIQGR
jgi:hypothetical protein